VQAQDLDGEPGPPKARRGRRVAAIIAALAVVAVVLAGGLEWWYNSATAAQQQAQAEKKADDSAAFWAKVEEDNRTSSVKSQMKAKGWHQASDDSYYKWEDDSQYTCSVLDCSYLLVVSTAPNGCPGGFYVEASIERNSISVGLANGVTVALPQGKVAAVRLEDVSGTGSGKTFHLSALTCQGG
jgi:cytoskeletal protein RodZ